MLAHDYGVGDLGGLLPKELLNGYQRYCRFACTTCRLSFRGLIAVLGLFVLLAQPPNACALDGRLWVALERLLACYGRAYLSRRRLGLDLGAVSQIRSNSV